MTTFEEKRANYIPRNPVEIVLSSKNGTQIGDLDGKKVYELESEVIARKDERILLHLKKAFIPFSFYTISSSQNNNKLDVKETNSLGATNTYVVTIEDGNYTACTHLPNPTAPTPCTLTLSPHPNFSCRDTSPPLTNPVFRQITIDTSVFGVIDFLLFKSPCAQTLGKFI